MNDYFAKRKEQVNTALDQLINGKPSTPHSSLFEAARYSLLSTGKRLRPLLAISTAETYGATLEEALIPACALEIIHTYSLIHDDLPCMDDDDFRRGKPTLHKVYTEGHAVLTGDFLLTFAFELLTQGSTLTPEQKVALIRTLSERAGADGMIGGQIVDLLVAETSVDWETLELLHHKKTACLITAALEFGGIIGKAPSPDMALLRAIGKNLGLAFQVVDDILDSSEEEKTRANAVHLLGKDKAEQLADALFEKALQSINALSHSAPHLHHLAEQLIYRNV